jgi:thioredoxin 2
MRKEEVDLTAVVRCPECGTKNRLRPNAEGVPRCAKCKSFLPWITAAGESTFEEETRARVPVLVDFWAPWCAPCLQVEPLLRRLAAEHAGQLKVVEVNVDEEPRLAQRFEAMSIPLLVLMRDGQEIDRIVGAPPPAELRRRLEQALEANPETTATGRR